MHVHNNQKDQHDGMVIQEIGITKRLTQRKGVTKRESTHPSPKLTRKLHKG